MTELYNSELLAQITEQGSLKSYRIKKDSTVAEVLKEMNLENKYFALIVNNKKVGIDYKLKENEELVILPKIAGGIDTIEDLI
ncbi:MAG: MoaD/ThiS family protein [Candidatus Nanoarchaeia archaeon]|nr:MoaD/ThiS family protein [Candidatus Nanoarchaeia archaeon]